MASAVVQDQKAITKDFVREQTGALGTALRYVLTDGSWRAEAAYAELLAVMSMMVTVDLITVGLEQPLLQLPSADSIAAVSAIHCPNASLKIIMSSADNVYAVENVTYDVFNFHLLYYRRLPRSWV
jgi:hypothetical protein